MPQILTIRIYRTLNVGTKQFIFCMATVAAVLQSLYYSVLRNTHDHQMAMMTMRFGAFSKTIILFVAIVLFLFENDENVVIAWAYACNRKKSCWYAHYHQLNVFFLSVVSYICILVVGMRLSWRCALQVHTKTLRFNAAVIKSNIAHGRIVTLLCDTQKHSNSHFLSLSPTHTCARTHTHTRTHILSR